MPHKPHSICHVTLASPLLFPFPLPRTLPNALGSVSWCLSVFVGRREGGRQPQVWLCDFVSGSIRNMPPNAEQWPSCSRCWKLWKLWSNQRPQRWPGTAIDLLPPPPLPPSRSRSNSLTVSWGSTPTLQWLLMLPQHSHMWHMRPWLQLQTDFATGLPGWRLVVGGLGAVGCAYSADQLILPMCVN